MFDIFTNESTKYNNFTTEHYLPILTFLLLAYFLISLSKKLPNNQQNKLGFYISLIPALVITLRMFIHWETGTFTLQDDLPLHLCRALPFFAPFMLLFRSYRLFNILYFLIMAGTLNAVITADVEQGFPHYEYLIYWFLHLGLIFAPIYAVFVFNFRPTIKGILHAFYAINIFLIFVAIVNYTINSNYLFIMHKPKVATIMDYLGPWPWYILSLEALVFVFSFIVYIPFLFVKTKK